MVILAVVSIYCHNVQFFLLGAGFSFLVFLYLNSGPLSKFKPFAGYANWITFLRLVALIVFIPLYSSFTPLTYGLILTAIVLFDLVDGFLARKFNQSSYFGMYFDMEVDAFFVLAMCLYYFLYRQTPIWIIIPGLLRYVYKIVTILVPKANFKETKRPYASIIAGTFFFILLISLILENKYQQGLLGFGSCLIAFSFSISFYEYFLFKSIAVNK